MWHIGKFVLTRGWFFILIMISFYGSTSVFPNDWSADHLWSANVVCFVHGEIFFWLQTSRFFSKNSHLLVKSVLKGTPDDFMVLDSKKFGKHWSTLIFGENSKLVCLHNDSKNWLNQSKSKRNWPWIDSIQKLSNLESLTTTWSESRNFFSKFLFALDGIVKHVRWLKVPDHASAVDGALATDLTSTDIFCFLSENLDRF